MHRIKDLGSCSGSVAKNLRLDSPSGEDESPCHSGF